MRQHKPLVHAAYCVWFNDLSHCFCPAEAGGLPDPTLLRTFDALKKTLVHLRGLMARVGDGSSGTCTLLEAHRFLWDRYRSIRKDITQTELIHRVSETGFQVGMLYVGCRQHNLCKVGTPGDIFPADLMVSAGCHEVVCGVERTTLSAVNSL